MIGKLRVPREMENQIGRTKTDGDVIPSVFCIIVMQKLGR